MGSVVWNSMMAASKLAILISVPRPVSKSQTVSWAYTDTQRGHSGSREERSFGAWKYKMQKPVLPSAERLNNNTSLNVAKSSGE